MQRNQRNTLVVDDEPVIREMLSDVLAGDGPCTCCPSASQAIELLERHSFDVVVADIVMPGIDGFELLERIVERQPAPQVVLISGQATGPRVRRALKAGAFDILQKPIDPAELRRVVAEAAALFHHRRDGSPDQLVPQPAISEGHDTLTGLLSHRTFLETLSRTRGQCRRRHEPLSLLMIDLDRFRQLNERHSHAVGDRVLTSVGQALQRLCRGSDIVARYHWDRFAVALPDSREGQAGELAQRCLTTVFQQPLVLDDRCLTLRASVGVAECGPGFVETERDLIERAEHALAIAKQRGGQQAVAFSTIVEDLPTRSRLNRASLDDVSRWIGTTRQQLKRTYVESTRALVGAVEAKDPFTRRHSMRVSDYAETLGTRLRLPAPQIEALKVAAILHDVGKIGIPDAVLQKPGPLTEEEYDVVKQHPQTALQILGQASFLSAELPLILHHHEHYDGRGYPAGLAGDEIPFGARILAVADALDAMFSRRSYKDSFTAGRVCQELNECSGRQWDPVVVDAALDWLDSNPDGVHRD
ncbi:MAG: HD domain-containing phosphohydrolase [Planctomycetota bacterium]|jgi:diguanylate cyclase (GGDEF)-like protein